MVWACSGFRGLSLNSLSCKLQEKSCMFPRILSLSRREQRGIFVLLLLFFVLAVCRISMPHWYPQTAYSVFLGDTLQAVFADFERSEEHTSELQSRPHLVCRLLLEKKNM